MIDWTRHIDTAIGILAQHNTVRAALPDVSAAIGYDVTEDAIRHAFKKRNMGSAAEWVKGADRQAEAANRQATIPDRQADRQVDATSAPFGLRVLVCPDAHHPFVDQLAWRTFLAAARALRPDVLVIIGDFIDSYSISSHTKDPARKIGFRDELDAANAALDQIDALRIPRVIYTEGNHETRLARAIAERAPEFHGLVDIRTLLRIGQRGYEWVAYKKFIRIGKIAFTHDVERCGVNAARQSLLDFGGNLVIGHTHRGAVVYQGTVDGDQHVCLNVGWLGSYEDIDYRSQARARREWQHGFGIVTIDETGCGWCEFVPILSGRCMVDGRPVSGRAAA